MSADAGPSPPGHLVRGPSALAGDPRRFVHLTRTLAVQDFKLRFFGSTLGYLWQLMRPLLLFGVLYLVFTQAIKLGASAKHFPVVLLTAIVLFTFFAEATSAAVTSVLDRESLVRKIHFPRLVVPSAVVLTALFNLALNLIAVAIFMLATGVEPRASWVQLPVLIGLLTVFAAGTAMLLSALYVRMRDIRPIWEVVLQVLFYASPIIYVIETVQSHSLRRFMLLNPLAAIIQQVRHAVIDPSAPSAAAAAGGSARLLVPLAIIVGAFGFGYWVFDREAPRIAEDM
ncbi:MAG: type transport system permease protein [Solirubrobacteraceae bacterium]|jgi:ABC-2 type transport system permease protein|nr:type transport system permease protein [Solirubrobacteraceae bacterium]